MGDALTGQPPQTYLNPVCDLPCADPFVLAWGGEFWAYCTGIAGDGRCFQVLRSPDLIRWEALGGAMAPLAGDFPMYWAPEVSVYNGRLWLYYSVGDEATMEIRVAVADHPGGPFVDCGRRLTGEPFAIDPHVFEDDDGARYLFYAVDFLDHSHIGTGTVCDRLIDPLTLAGAPQPVTRARHDWQVYDPRRAEKGGVRWHTVEGSFVLKRKGLYYQMFSGGNWQNVSYGVGYAVTDAIPADGEWRQVCDGEHIPPILRTLPGAVVGPGHNSAVVGPDLMQWFCVYHRWTADGRNRIMAIDRLEWIGERLAVLGPTTTPQPAPILAGSRGFDAAWQLAGAAIAAPDLLRLPASERASAWLPLATPHAIFECWVSLPDAGEGRLRIDLAQGDDSLAALELAPGCQEIAVDWTDAAGRQQRVSRAAHAAGWRGWSRLRVEIDGFQASLSFGGGTAGWTGRLRGLATGLRLDASDQTVACAGARVVAGWRQLFETDGLTAAELGWDQVGEQLWRTSQGALRCVADGWSAALRGPKLVSYELVVNLRLEDVRGADNSYGCLPVVADDGSPVAALLHPEGERWFLTCAGPLETARLELPPGFDPYAYQQLRFQKRGALLTMWLEALELGTIAVPAGGARIGLCAQRAAVAYEMVRQVALPS